METTPLRPWSLVRWLVRSWCIQPYLASLGERAKRGVPKGGERRGLEHGTRPHTHTRDTHSASSESMPCLSETPKFTSACALRSLFFFGPKRQLTAAERGGARQSHRVARRGVNEAVSLVGGRDMGGGVRWRAAPFTERLAPHRGATPRCGGWAARVAACWAPTAACRGRAARPAARPTPPPRARPERIEMGVKAMCMGCAGLYE